MAQIRTLKLNLLADTKNFQKGLRNADNQTQSFSHKIGGAFKAVGAAAATAGIAVAGAAVAFGVDAVKAALEDEKSQRRLNVALKNTTKATKAQLDAVAAYIDKTQLATGVVDDKLRPAFQRLTQATKDISKAQKLMTLALDISAGTGRDLELVANILGKAYNGNLASLQKLGLGIDKSIIKTGDFNKVVGILSKTFQGQASAAAESYQGKIERFKIAFDEFKESVGYKLLPVLMKTFDYIQTTVIPILGQVADGFQGKDPNRGVTNKVKALAGALGEPVANTPGYNLGQALKELADSFTLLLKALSEKPGDVSGTTNSLQSLADAINAVAGAFETLGRNYRRARGVFEFLTTNKIAARSPIGLMAKLDKFIVDKLTGRRALGGVVAPRTPYLVGEHGPELFMPSGSGNIVPNGRTGGTTIINLNGIVDAESARRTIERLLQQSSIRSGPINLAGSAL